MIRQLEIAAEIVAAYLSNNHLPTSEIGGLLHKVHAAVVGTTGPTAAAAPPQEPAVPIKKSVTRDHIICLEDGKKFKSMKRHLSTTYNLSPDAYRQKWGLPSDYPMVCPSYAESRAQLAKKIGLGFKQGAQLSSSKSKRKAA